MIDVQEAGHPVPDLKGQQATEQILALLDRFTADDLVFVLLSGVHRAFACSRRASRLPINSATALLLYSGATISEINTIRKHLGHERWPYGGGHARAPDHLDPV